jgi:hypothetical protein
LYVERTLSSLFTLLALLLLGVGSVEYSDVDLGHSAWCVLLEEVLQDVFVHTQICGRTRWRTDDQAAPAKLLYKHPVVGSRGAEIPDGKLYGLASPCLLIDSEARKYR